jgi:hypothetical protein
MHRYFDLLRRYNMAHSLPLCTENSIYKCLQTIVNAYQIYGFIFNTKIGFKKITKHLLAGIVTKK